MKARFFVLILILLSSQVFAQDSLLVPRDTSWKTSGFFSLNTSQVALANWAAGGESTTTLNTLINFNANYEKGDILWSNSFDLGYGLLKRQGVPVQKSDDKIEINSKFGRKVSEKLYRSVLFNFRSQLAKGYSLPNDSVVTSTFFSPAYVSLAIGYDYKPTSYLSIFVSPTSGKFTFVLNQTLADAGAFGVDPAMKDTAGNVIKKGKNIHTEFGATMNIKFEKEIVKNVSLLAKALFFNNFTDKNVQNRGNIDVNIEALLNMKINKYMAASIFANLIYDHDINIPTYQEINGEKVQTGEGPKTQFKEVLGIGFSYKF